MHERESIHLSQSFPSFLKEIMHSSCYWDCSILYLKDGSEKTYTTVGAAMTSCSLLGMLGVVEMTMDDAIMAAWWRGVPWTHQYLASLVDVSTLYRLGRLAEGDWKVEIGGIWAMKKVSSE